MTGAAHTPKRAQTMRDPSIDIKQSTLVHDNHRPNRPSPLPGSILEPSQRAEAW
jgi:hypothetical protein